MTDPIRPWHERAAELLASATEGPLYVVEGRNYSKSLDGLYGTPPPDDCDAGGELWDQREDKSVWTVSRLPDRHGWETDGGCPGYGPSKADASLWAAAPTLLREALEERGRLLEMIEELKDEARVASEIDTP